MAIVPRIQRTQRLNPLPGVRKTAAETPLSTGAELARTQAQADLQTGAAVAGGLRPWAAHFIEIEEQAREQADQTAVLKARRRIADWKNARIYDPEQGALTRRGEAAMTLPEEVRDEYDKLTGEIEVGLASDRQRQAFENVKAQEWDQLDLQVRRHVFDQMQEFRAGEAKALIDSSILEAQATYADPDISAAALTRATDAIKQNAAALRLSPKQVDLAVLETQTKAHVGVIENLLADEQDEAAGEYFTVYEKQIAGDQLDRIKKALKEGDLRGQSQRKADEILAAGGTLEEQLEKVKALKPELRDAVQDRLEHADVMTQRNKKAAEENAERTAYDILDKTSNITKIPPAMWASFDGPTRSAMRSYARQKAEGTPVKTDQGVFYKLIGMAGDNPEQFAKENLLAYKGKLSDGDFQQIAGWQMSIKNGARSALNKDLDYFRSSKQVVDDTLRQWGYNPEANPKTDQGQASAVVNLRRMVDNRIAVMVESGAKPSPVDVQQIVDQILSGEFTTPTSWFGMRGGNKKRLIDSTIEDVPATERQQIEDALRKRGRPVNDQSILDTFIEARSRGLVK